MSTLRFLILRDGDTSVCGQNDFGIPSNTDGGSRGLSLLFTLTIYIVGSFIIFGSALTYLSYSSMFDGNPYITTFSGLVKYLDEHSPTEHFLGILIFI